MALKAISFDINLKTYVLIRFQVCTDVGRRIWRIK